MAIRDILMSAAGSNGSAKLYSDDVFSAYTYTGNGGTQTINNGIDLAGEGGMVWIKDRTIAQNHIISDTARGAGYFINSNTTNASNFNTGVISSFNANGFTTGAVVNTANDSLVSWTFRKAPKFFDVIAWTGNGVSLGTVKTHALTQTPGTVFVKCTSAASDWYVWHRGTSAGNFLKLNTTDAQSNTLAATFFGNGTTTVNPTSSGITVGVGLNSMSATYVAYIFSHDTSADGLIQCGSFSGNAIVTLGWEPQFLLVKNYEGADSWVMVDTARGLGANGNADGKLYCNGSGQEGVGSAAEVTATGFTATGFSGLNCIYIAIRRPNKPPTSGTQVYNAALYTGNAGSQTVETGYPPISDLVMMRPRASTTYMDGIVQDALTRKHLKTNLTDAEAGSVFDGYGPTGFTIGNSARVNANSIAYVNHFFKRAPGFFDIVCYTGTGVAHTEAHGLGVVPELIIFKSRNDSTRTIWNTYHTFTATTMCRNLLYTTGAKAGPATYAAFGNFTGPPTASGIPLSAVEENFSGNTNVAYLFATLAGVSKVGSYTGNGTSQTIACGFTAGARFILIKRTDAAGDWYVWDTVRGIVAGNDPHLSLNSTTAEITTDDSIDPDSSGFIVNQLSATAINVTSASYIFLAIA